MNARILLAAVCWLLLPSVGRSALTWDPKFDDNAASTVVAVATVGSNGTLAGGDNTSVVHSTDAPGGSITSSFRLNGSDDRVTFASGALTGTLTWSIWAKRASTSTVDILFGFSAGGAKLGFSANTTTMFMRGVGGGASATPAHGVTTTGWHHYVIIRDSSNLWKCYVDSVLISANVFSGAQSGSVSYDLVGYDDGPNPFDGYLAFAKLYNTDESANVAALYAEGTGAPASNAMLLLIGSIEPPRFRFIQSGRYQVAEFN